MKLTLKLAILVPFLFVSSLMYAPMEAQAETVQLKKPNIHINEKGKVDVKAGDGTVKTKEFLLTDFIKKYRVIIAGISGIGTVSMILFFILGFMRLGATASNPEGRSKAIVGLICSGVGAAGLGAVTLITGLFFNAL